MPFFRISLRHGTSPEYRKALADGVHRAMVEAIAIPPDDRFQVVTEHPPEGLIYNSQYLGVRRSDRIVLVQITLSFGRKPQQKRKHHRVAAAFRMPTSGSSRNLRGAKNSPRIAPQSILPMATVTLPAILTSGCST